jgi:hypothetical protein
MIGSYAIIWSAAAASNPHHSKPAALYLAICTSLHTKLSVLSAENPPPGGFSASGIFALPLPRLPSKIEARNLLSCHLEATFQSMIEAACFGASKGCETWIA